MDESEIEPLAPFVFGIVQVMLLLLRRLGVPNLVALPVTPHVVDLDGTIYHDVETGHADQYAVAAAA